VTFAAPDFLCDLARAQGAHTRNLVILYLGGGNDSLSMLVPYNDSSYYSRRPTLAVPAGQVLQIGSDSSRVALGLHPRLTDLKAIFDQGRLAFIQRTGYDNQSRSHFQGTDIWSTADPNNSQGLGWLGRYLDSVPPPALWVGWNTTASMPIAAGHVGVPAIATPGRTLLSPNRGTRGAAAERDGAAHQLARACGSAGARFVRRLAGRVRHARPGGDGRDIRPSVTIEHRAGTGAQSRCRGMARAIGTKVFYVTTGGFDTHSAQNVNQANGTYFALMGTINDALRAFYTDLRNQGLLDDTMLVTFSEFGRRISENGSAGTDHGAASVMMVLGGRVNGGLYGTAPVLRPDPGNPTLENNTADVHYETDFRSVYARVIDEWLGADSKAILGADYRKSTLTFI
jgi:uncharacterized protein (DUF1501 family)